MKLIHDTNNPELISDQFVELCQYSVDLENIIYDGDFEDDYYDIIHEVVHDMTEWCQQNSTGYVMVDDISCIRFQNNEDLIAFRIYWIGYNWNKYYMLF